MNFLPSAPLIPGLVTPTVATLALGAACTLGLVGCGSPSDVQTGTTPLADGPSNWSSSGDPSGRPAGSPGPGADVEQTYVVGPTAARKLGYRIDWQARMPTGRRPLRMVSPQFDSVFALDEENYLTRLSRADGERLWHIPVSRPGEEILGITYVPESERVLLTAGASVLEVDSTTGSLFKRQELDKVANTEPVRMGPYLIYGARNGQICWHSFATAFNWRAYQVSRSIKVNPVLDGDYLLVAGTDGRIMVLNASTASQHWSKKLLNAVVAEPVISNQVAYVAATDQYLYAFEIDDGRTLWAKLMSSPLVDSPMVIGDRVYQQVPGEGLTCFDALPLDDPGGHIFWQTPEVTGSVITRNRGDLLAWDQNGHQMARVTTDGAVVDLTSLPNVDQLFAPKAGDGELIAVATDGRILKLVPRN